MSLYRVGRIWYVDITRPDGSRDRHSTGTADRKAAQEYHDRLKAQYWREARLGDPPASTWGDAVRDWLLEAPRDLSDRYRLSRLPIPLELPLDKVDQSVIERALAGKSAPSWNRTLNLILAILNLARARGKLIAVPKVRRKPLSPSQRARVRWLTAEEWARLEAALPHYLAQIARFTLATGLRENNVLQLTWSQVDLHRRVAWIHADQAKAGEPIGVPLNEDAMAVLRERQAEQAEELRLRRATDPGAQPVPWVFAHRGRPLYKASNKAWYRALKSAGLEDVRWHDLRHTWASWHVMRGTRLEELQELGGWKTLQMVRRYAHLAPDHLAKVAENVKPVSLRHSDAIAKTKNRVTSKA
ncbi:site-specific integrase [Pelomicrobium methylotrophicum]|uniref:Site-specific integrase n=1 Tax=Pelomicrobium methylotrophicum TaxID=2602750 RepID=A0A5C7ERG5_9PROT|nr:site-specific integrase [Pelomicrobium methylotrophicum]TXF11236.1 site-specific integrase [Pelomicrobium methylotrophicum]